MMSLESVEDLKESWLGHPIWDIEDSEGFEIFRQELIVFRENIEKRWEELRLKELQRGSERLGVPGNHAIVQKFEAMQQQIDSLLNRVYELENR